MNAKVLISILLLSIGLAIAACSPTANASSRATTIINSPPSNSQFREGELLSVTSTSNDTDGIAKVELVVDGAVVQTDPSPTNQVSFTVTQHWIATAGSHTITVRAINAQNKSTEPAAILINVTPRGTPTTLQTPSPTAGQSSSRACAFNATFVSDVTIPDGTAIAPGAQFNKVWRVRNTGTCAWGTGEELAFTRGESMTNTRTIQLPPTAPGDTADLTLTLNAPSAPGNHTGEWRLRSRDTSLFGATLRVLINVPNATQAGCPFTPTIESFVASPTTIAPGQTATLTWGAVVSAERAEIDNGIGGVATPGSVQVQPQTTTTYTLTATCGNKVRTAQVTINVATSSANPSPTARPSIVPTLPPNMATPLP